MSTEIVRFEITDGDNKFELFRQLMMIGARDSKSKHIDLAGFGVSLYRDGLSQKPWKDQLRIDGIKARDASGDEWLIFGSYVDSQQTIPELKMRVGNFEGEYNTRSRSGYIIVSFFK